MSQKEIRTHVAHHLVGDNRYFGLSVNSLVGNETYTGMMALAVTGRRPTDEQRQALDDIAVILTSADPRIWPLKMTRLISSYGGTLAGHVAGQLALEGDQIGPWTSGRCAQMFVELNEFVGDTNGDDALLESRVRDFVARTPRFFGYGVPLRTFDERFKRLAERVQESGRDKLPFWTLQEALSREIKRVKGLPPNVSAGLAASYLDHGYSAREIPALTMFLQQNVFVANAIEAATQSEEVMRQLPDSAIDYVGQAPRISPRAIAREEISKESALAANSAVSRA